MTLDLHDPGGKSTFPLPDGMVGGAEYTGPRSCYRFLLWRRWNIDYPLTRLKDYALFCGMNPSTARADVNDPTIVREIGFTKRFGLSTYVKVNILDYRATNPDDLLKVDGPRSMENLPAIRNAAADADIIIMAYGVMHKSFEPEIRETVEMLRKDGRELWCLGRTKAGHPRHPLYLKSDTPLERFE